METILPISPGTQALRKGRHSQPSRIYSITCVCNSREKVFSDEAHARLAAKALTDKKLWPDAKCLAWVVMPDHVHVLVELGNKESLPLTIQRMKSLIAIEINRERCRRNPVWQRGYYDHALRKDEDICAAARYIINNPIRAGLAASIDEYSYWSVCEEWLADATFTLW